MYFFIGTGPFFTIDFYFLLLKGRVFERNEANQFAEVEVVIADVLKQIKRVQEEGHK